MRNKSLAGRANNRAERPRKVAIYIRVSTTHQIDKDSLPMQRFDILTESHIQHFICFIQNDRMDKITADGLSS